MQTNRKVGMRMMNDSLADLVKRGLVDADEAMAKSVDKDSLRSLLKSGSGESGKESAKQDAS
jgi:Tfp pilus assembly pilus retraction ATPase PilT